MSIRYRVNGKDMDGINGWFVVDTHHPIYKTYPTDHSSFHCYGLSMNKQEMIELAEKMNREDTKDIIRRELKDIESKSLQGIF